MGVIARWTTPGIRYTPKLRTPDQIVEVYMVLKQNGVVLSKSIEDAELVDDGKAFFWHLTQEETSRLISTKSMVIKIDYKDSNGERFTTESITYSVDESAKNEVI